MNTPIRRALTIASVCLVGVLSAALATAQPGSKAAPAPSSIAIVDLAKLTANLDEAKVLKDRLKLQADDYQKNLQEVKTELANVTKDLEGLKDKKGTPEYLKQLARKYELDATLKARGEGLQQLIDIAEGDNMKAMFGRVLDAVTRLGKERGYDLILWDDRTISAPPANIPATGAQVWNLIRDRRIMYASDGVDITAQVLTQMNNEFKAAKK